ncbi:PREDICTED: chromosome transmission fidelity protein 18 homolog [Poecilia mexicana]|uniref:chromosome transmission fidelity protein 18 homolog n=1 Tax=Poecilia mexicana TaxID=48701 RepID=UPI00072E180E|nr:PREDICTED: chromosome transmission fidelity protein 18 homolog [Poecilia mexicana]
MTFQTYSTFWIISPAERNDPSQDDNITPPSSPEHYEPSNTFRSTPAVLDISGLAEIPGTPRRPVTSPPPSRCVLRRPPLEGDFISVTDSSGNRVYLRQKGEADTKTVNSRILPNSHGALGLLALPVRVLREQEAERVSQSVQLCEVIKLPVGMNRG